MMSWNEKNTVLMMKWMMLNKTTKNMMIMKKKNTISKMTCAYASACTCDESFVCTWESRSSMIFVN